MSSAAMKSSRFERDHERWCAVVNRDRAADGTFWYSVRTTGVFCRPSCSARRPRRENIAFHGSTDAAREAGFRPCRKCHPESDHIGQAALIDTACRQIETAEELPTLDTLAKAAGLSRFHFHRLFKSYTGVTPKAYADARRVTRARAGLSGHGSITQTVFDAGFNSSGRFYAQAVERLGMTPGDYRKGGAGMELQYAIARCSLGAILVAATARGICAIDIGDDPDLLVTSLLDRFPRALIVEGDPAFDQLVIMAVALAEEPAKACELPLDIRGTAFQQRVWETIRKIPSGETMTYTELAQRIGQPRAARAVARACGANSIAIAIPCHRIVRTDGSLSGYRWGIARKRVLLDRERS